MGALLFDEIESVTPTCRARSKAPLPLAFCRGKSRRPALLCRYNARPELFQVVKMQPVTNLFLLSPLLGRCCGTAPFLPCPVRRWTSSAGDSCDIVLVTGDAYRGSPSFGMAVIGRMLESQGFRVGIIANRTGHRKMTSCAWANPTLFYGVTAGNMDSMINRYTADKNCPRRRLHPGMWAASNRIAPPWSTPSAAKRP